MRLLQVLICLLGLALPAAANEAKPDSALLHRMLAAREKGEINSPDYYSDTSADVLAYYLMAYAWDGSSPREQRQKQAQLLFAEILGRQNRNGDCIGWGIGADLDAFGDKTVNPASTIYLYTSARVIQALTAAEKAGLIEVPRDTLKQAACSFKTLFHFDPAKPRLQYSDNSNDAPYFVFNTVADLAVASTLLSDRMGDESLRDMAKQACAILVGNTRDDGFLPYFEGRGTTDPAHHAMVINGLILCQNRYGLGADAIRAATSFLRSHYFQGSEFTPGEAAPEWAAGEALIALTDICKVDAGACKMKEQVLEYVRKHERDGAVNNKASRFQSWLAAGVAYATR